MKNLSDVKFLVTGATGFIGSHLVDKLIREGANVKILTRDVEYARRYRYRGRLEIVKGDILTPSSLKFEDDIDVVFHLAAVVPGSMQRRVETKDIFNTNVVGTFNLLNNLLNHDLEIFYVSTAAVYGDPEYLPINEQHPTNPKNIYATSKLLGEVLTMGYGRIYGFPVGILRLSNVYGPRQKMKALVPILINKALKGKPLILEDPKASLDLIYVKDVISAFIRVFQMGCQGIFNIASGYAVKTICIVKKIVNTINPNIPIVTLPSRSDDYMDDKWFSLIDIEKIKSLGWKPVVTLDDGIRMTIEWYRRNLI